MATAAPSVCAETLSINRAGVGGVTERLGPIYYPSMLHCSPVSPFQDGSLGSCQAALLSVCVCVSEDRSRHSKTQMS